MPTWRLNLKSLNIMQLVEASNVVSKGWEAKAWKITELRNEVLLLDIQGSFDDIWGMFDLWTSGRLHCEIAELGNFLLRKSHPWDKKLVDFKKVGEKSCPKMGCLTFSPKIKDQLVLWWLAIGLVSD